MLTWPIALTAAVAGYLLGAIPSAAIAARARGRRIFEVGSGNMGAMNTARNLGVFLGIAVFVADVAKGAAATAVALGVATAFGIDAAAGLAVALIAGVAAVAGHAWSLFVGGRGGKALATIFGVSLPLYPWGGLAGAALIVALVLLTRRATLAAVVTLVAYPWLVAGIAWRSGEPVATAYALFAGTLPLAIISLVKHARSRSGRNTPVDTGASDDRPG